MAEKQATIHSLQRKAKSLKQSLQSKELHVTILQKKLKTYEERISSYVRLQEKVDSSNKKVRCANILACSLMSHFLV